MARRSCRCSTRSTNPANTRLSRTSIADEMREEHRRRVLRVKLTARAAYDAQSAIQTIIAADDVIEQPAPSVGVLSLLSSFVPGLSDRASMHVASSLSIKFQKYV